MKRELLKIKRSNNQKNNSNVCECEICGTKLKDKELLSVWFHVHFPDKENSIPLPKEFIERFKSIAKTLNDLAGYKIIDESCIPETVPNTIKSTLKATCDYMCDDCYKKFSKFIDIANTSVEIVNE